jgi:hypothetical protein
MLLYVVHRLADNSSALCLADLALCYCASLSQLLQGLVILLVSMHLKLYPFVSIYGHLLFLVTGIKMSKLLTESKNRPWRAPGPV